MIKFWIAASAFSLLAMTFPTAQADERTACDIRKRELLSAIEKVNRCNKDEDCSFVEFRNCRDGCVLKPINKWLETQIEIPINYYQRACGGSACAPKCAKYLQAKCVIGRCQLEQRDWKYLTKEKP